MQFPIKIIEIRGKNNIVDQYTKEILYKMYTCNYIILNSLSVILNHQGN